MWKTIKNYFKYHPDEMYFGYGGAMAILWLNKTTYFENLWFNLIFFIYAAYCGNKILIVLASSGVIGLSIYNFFQFWPEQKQYLSNYLFIIWVYLFFFRDMYFIYKYKMNAFTYKAKNQAEYQSGKRLFNVGLTLLVIICWSFFLWVKYSQS